ncbi:hypothetical protein NIES2107_11560 [Nostoc carneum NIES-2107]|nr:hypothetical protein NIES2107_11560 [Nostoc carneum NIES-2107]
MEKNLDNKRQFWLTRVEPFDGESISHFLGRFRRAKGNKFSAPSGLGHVVGLGAVLVRWEKFYFHPFPTQQELEALAAVVELDSDRLRQMLPPVGVGMKHSPIRLCGACYAESPCHKIEWQFKKTGGCDRHQLRLLSKCPVCEKPFVIPALWVEGQCSRCFTSFAEMAQYQKPY